jgi:hypothetical protein
MWEKRRERRGGGKWYLCLGNDKESEDVAVRSEI